MCKGGRDKRQKGEKELKRIKKWLVFGVRVGMKCWWNCIEDPHLRLFSSCTCQFQERVASREQIASGEFFMLSFRSYFLFFFFRLILFPLSGLLSSREIASWRLPMAHGAGRTLSIDEKNTRVSFISHSQFRWSWFFKANSNKSVIVIESWYLTGMIIINLSRNLRLLDIYQYSEIRRKFYANINHF